ncbi:uncharacterized protein BP01DRAFT_363326 [Aspergillus saccharolyticus JOP 1030-1]|uniref:F-box domain-containing protein n=1 Tax=Aspergillus saccharolyticus JOP 1030-1 TaxID=1450539 RepID=A0A318ZNQ4_9EURO|nr:hypothetical protein BP01DRAFT_363326 [Aspergillus saccharolyticus JOP 1030-1]PYH48154.1 hypothetical protein BP01DRAFT_363326 [Aspergillus saccharolyticus JOP 1030-1]
MASAIINQLHVTTRIASKTKGLGQIIYNILLFTEYTPYLRFWGKGGPEWSCSTWRLNCDAFLVFLSPPSPRTQSITSFVHLKTLTIVSSNYSHPDSGSASVSLRLKASSKARFGTSAVREGNPSVGRMNNARRASSIEYRPTLCGVDRYLQLVPRVSPRYRKRGSGDFMSPHSLQLFEMSALDLPSHIPHQHGIQKSLNIHDLHGLDKLKSQDASWSDIDEDSESDDEFISPISDKPPSWSGTRWARFFPELASHFSLTSPTSSTPRSPSSAGLASCLNSPTSLKSPDSTVGEERPPSVSSDEASDKRSSRSTLRFSIMRPESLVSSPRRDTSLPIHASSPSLSKPFAGDGMLQDSPSRKLSRHLSFKETRERPLSRIPSFQLPPLLARRKSHHLPRGREAGNNNYRSLNSPSLPDIQENYHRPPLSQAAVVAVQNPTNFADPLQTQTRSPHNHLRLSERNSQSRRDNMGSIATRPAPISPMSIHDVQQAIKAQSREGMGQTMPDHKNKGSFSFGLSGLNQWSSPPNLHHSGNHFAGAKLIPTPPSSHLTQSENKDEVAELPGSPVNVSNGIPASSNSTREARSKHSTRSALDTKDVDNPGFKDSSPPQTIAKKANEVANHKSRYNKLNDAVLVGSSEKYFVSHSKYGGLATNTSRRQDASQTPTIYELDANSAASQIESHSNTTSTVPTLPEAMNTTLPEGVILTILRQVDSLDDLFSISLICKTFFRTFKDHELELIKDAVFAMSPPAWELRERSPPWSTDWQVLLDPDAPVPEYTPSLYLKHYAQDICTVAQLKSVILSRCSSFLRPETIRGLSGLDDALATEVDDAFWRVWTFCRIFGCGKNREGDIAGQMDWIKGGTKMADQRVSVAHSITDHYDMGSVLFEPPPGFGYGNAGGLSQEQLHTMTEIWNCLGVLLQPMHGKAKMAREAGIFDGHNVKENATAKEDAVLEEWTHYILTLGLSAVLNLGSITTDESAVAANFRKAKTMGLTNWLSSDSVASRSSFLREAVSKAYGSRGGGLSEASFRSSSPIVHDCSPVGGSAGKSDSTLEMQRRRQAAYSAQLKIRKQQTMNLPPPKPAEERPISNYEMIISRLEGKSRGPARAESLVSPPRGSSTVPGLHQRNAAPSLQQPQVRDPTDKAMDLLVRELGFKEEDAKWALKITDSGEGINASAAVSLLTREHRNRQDGRGGTTPPSGSLLSSVINSPESRTSGWKWARS